MTERHAVRTVAARWDAHYSDRAPGDWADRMSQHLRTLDGETATAAEVDALLGTDTWTIVVCDECGARVRVAVELGEPPDAASRTATRCLPCLAHAWQMVLMAAGEGLAP